MNNKIVEAEENVFSGLQFDLNLFETSLQSRQLANNEKNAFD